MECVPNFSEGRDLEKIEKIVDKFRAKAGVKLLDYSNDEDHNRLVVTVVGEPEALKDALLEAIGQAVELIDLTKHSGQHPRMGAVDVVPFIPIRGCTMDEAIALSKEVGEKVAALYRVPVFLYEKSASAPHRENLAAIRKGEFEGMEAKIKQPEWKPDFGPAESTPPDNAHRTLPLPTFSRIALMDSSTKESIFQSPQHPQMLRTKLYSILEPSTV